MSVSVVQANELSAEFAERLGQWVKREREARGWSPGYLARRCGLSRTAIRDLEDGRPDGRRPSATIETMVRLAVGFGYDPGYVFLALGGNTGSPWPSLDRYLIVLQDIPEEDRDLALAVLQGIRAARGGGNTHPPAPRKPARRSGAREGAASPEASGSRNGRSDWLIGQILNLQRSA